MPFVINHMPLNIPVVAVFAICVKLLENAWSVHETRNVWFDDRIDKRHCVGLWLSKSCLINVMDVMDVCITLVLDLHLSGTKDPQPCARRKFERFLGLSKLGNIFLNPTWTSSAFRDKTRPTISIPGGPTKDFFELEFNDERMSSI